ncbi:MAG: large-conductance mechanosensitive channel protein MscL [Akkermansia sp.]|nr:large-conductance mechanosensitive channel protein MscL [Akkermansia sp.]
MLKKSKGFLAEFKAFALKGNVIDLAVAVVIGAAFNKIVSTFVASIITPIMGYLTSGVDLTKLAYVLDTVTKPDGKVEEVAIKYGEFIQVSIDFVIIAFSIFCAIKIISAFKRKEEEAPAPEPAPEPEKPADVVLLEEIRDLLKNK